MVFSTFLCRAFTAHYLVDPKGLLAPVGLFIHSIVKFSRRTHGYHYPRNERPSSLNTSYGKELDQPGRFVLFNGGSACGFALVGAVKLLGDELAMPREDRVGGDYRRHLFQRLLAQFFP